VVSYLKNQDVFKNIQNQIKQISDLERLISKLLPAKYRRVKWFT
jgi:DNA mismatch repair protein MutS